MKNINNFINEKLRISSKNYKQYKYHPKTPYKLRKILEKRLKDDKDADLNDIDVCEITNMGYFDSTTGMWGLFYGLDPHNIDISEWDVSNVRDMLGMFRGCKNFTGHGLENWDVSNVKDMEYMFFDCEHFNCDLSNWDVKNVENMERMFYNCEKFNCDLNNWKVANVKNMNFMFAECPLKNNPPKWY